jgi:putative DNA primase/helicase
VSKFEDETWTYIDASRRRLGATVDSAEYRAAVVGEERQAAIDRGHEARANPRVTLTPASEIEPKPIAWVWRHWLAQGMIHILAGQPGIGKSTLAYKLAAIVSTGGEFPDGTRADAGNVVIWSGEDSPEHTIVPKIECSGADRRHVHIVTGSNDGKARPFDPSRDLEALQRACDAIGDVRLIVIDPIVSVIGGKVDSHKNSETRNGLQPLVEFAATTGAAVVGIHHLAKSSSERAPVERLCGSIAFAAVARVVLFAVAQEPDESGSPKPNIFVRAKSNIGPDKGGFEYVLHNEYMYSHPDIETAVAVFGNAVEGCARTILSKAETVPKEERSAKGGEARGFLLAALAGGPRLAAEVKTEAEAVGITEETLKRARKRVGVVAEKVGYQGAWVWSLPDTGEATLQRRSRNLKDVHSQGETPFERSDPLWNESVAISDKPGIVPDGAIHAPEDTEWPAPNGSCHASEGIASAVEEVPESRVSEAPRPHNGTGTNTSAIPAGKWLADYLGGGPKPTCDVVVAGAKAGFGVTDIYAAAPSIVAEGRADGARVWGLRP